MSSKGYDSVYPHVLYFKYMGTKTTGTMNKLIMSDPCIAEYLFTNAFKHGIHIKNHVVVCYKDKPSKAGSTESNNQGTGEPHTGPHISLSPHFLEPTFPAHISLSPRFLERPDLTRRASHRTLIIYNNNHVNYGMCDVSAPGN